MPISANPNVRVPFMLEHWGSIPEAVRPALLVKFLTVAEHQRHADLMERAFETKDNAEAWRLLWEAIRVGIDGWRNVRGPDGKDLPFTEGTFFSETTDRERWEIAWRYASVVRLTPVDLGN